MQGGLLVAGLAAAIVVGGSLEEPKKPLLIAGATTALAVGGGLLCGIIKHGAKPTLTLAGRLFAYWGIAPIVGAAIVLVTN